RFFDQRGGAAPGGLDETSAAKRSGEVDDRRRAVAFVERDGPAVRERRLDREPALADGHVALREVEQWIEQRPHCEERVRLAGAGLADQRADRARAEHEPSRAPEVDDADLLEQSPARAHAL